MTEEEEKSSGRDPIKFDLSGILMADALSRLALLHISLHHNTTPLFWPLIRASTRLDLSYKSCLVSSCQPNRASRIKVHAVVAEESDRPKWWERNAGPNMIDIHSTQEFLNALSHAGDRLVFVEFYGTWCGSCRALFPRLCKTAEEHPDIMFLKVNFDENKPMCKRLNVRVLPFFHFYRGADGLLESFSCSIAKFQKLKDAIATHNTPRCSIGPTLGVGNLLESATPQEKPAEASSR